MQGWLISCKTPSHTTPPDPDLPHLKVFCFSGCEIFPDHRITGYYVNIDTLNISLFDSSGPFEGPEISASFSFAILIENKKAPLLPYGDKKEETSAGLLKI